MNEADNCAFCFGVPDVRTKMLAHALKCESHPLKLAIEACQNVVDRIDEMSAQTPADADPLQVLRSMAFNDFVDMYNGCQAALRAVEK